MYNQSYCSTLLNGIVGVRRFGTDSSASGTSVELASLRTHRIIAVIMPWTTASCKPCAAPSCWAFPLAVAAAILISRNATGDVLSHCRCELVSQAGTCSSTGHSETVARHSLQDRTQPCPVAMV